MHKTIALCALILLAGCTTGTPAHQSPIPGDFRIVFEKNVGSDLWAVGWTTIPELQRAFTETLEHTTFADVAAASDGETVIRVGTTCMPLMSPGARSLDVCSVQALRYTIIENGRPGPTRTISPGDWATLPMQVALALRKDLSRR